MADTKYKCAKCGIAVLVIPGQDPVRPCSCDAPIIGAMSSTLEGAGGVKT